MAHKKDEIPRRGERYCHLDYPCSAYLPASVDRLSRSGFYDFMLPGVIALGNASPTIAGISYIDIVRPLVDTIQPSHAAL